VRIPADVIDAPFVSFVSELYQTDAYQQLIGASQILWNLETYSHQIPYFDFFVERPTGKNTAIDS